MGDVVLAGKSILESVALRVEGANKVEEVCRAALFHEIVRDLTDGYEMILGGGSAAGVALSGGQKQRLAIARVRLTRAYLSLVSIPSYFIMMFLYLHLFFRIDEATAVRNFKGFGDPACASSRCTSLLSLSVYSAIRLKRTAR
jgi:hypothetical protein